MNTLDKTSTLKCEVDTQNTNLSKKEAAERGVFPDKPAPSAEIAKGRLNILDIRYEHFGFCNEDICAVFVSDGNKDVKETLTAIEYYAQIFIAEQKLDEKTRICPYFRTPPTGEAMVSYQIAFIRNRKRKLRGIEHE